MSPWPTAWRRSARRRRWNRRPVYSRCTWRPGEASSKVEAAPDIDCEEEDECTTEEQVSYYDSYMASRKHVKDATADVTPQEAENVSLFDSYMSSSPAPPR
ncbi:hypothetical protein Esi_0048_0115 [Ectocarpus siliculosus]|uniref:Uncharacterized protein n=1 Tax=Ectocarpus siliculosus TaxID=2880 RepID=D7G2R3_ECTSI|nr:hypothetical protein Esi_0048_0115 [Ectocarpus siliculosus]|eukprot:CBJ26888.1 hypothetical protein Esi_0048_0115 [Ectocarpus siliculosus]